MLFLRREQAPISPAAWAEIDEEAKRTLKLHLAARKLVDFAGPHGWQRGCVDLGRAASTDAPTKGVEAKAREVLPLIELKVPFRLSRAELESVDRGARDPDLDALIEGAKTLARAEDSVVFAGHATSGAVGIAGGSDHDPLTIDEDYEQYPGTVARAVNQLRDRGVDGPYGIALGPRCYAGLVQAPAGGGYPVLNRLRNVLTGPIVWAPAVDGAVVMSTRGGDYQLHVGQDVSVGYQGCDEKEVHLYLVESLTFLNLAPEAGIALRYEAS